MFDYVPYIFVYDFVSAYIMYMYMVVTIQHSELQVIAVKATLHKPINICCIHLPPHDPIHNQKLDKLIVQIPKPHILLGDFNCHNTIWGCQKNQQKGHRFGKVYQ